MTYELATGGTITIDTPTLVEHQFTAGGSFALISPGTLDVDYLVVAGGGGAGNGPGGGGGAGGMLTGSTAVSTTQTVTIGAGGVGRGPGGSPAKTNGGNSVFGAFTAIGGGEGAFAANTDGDLATSGGSGGGGGYNSGTPGSGTGGQGNAGAAGNGNSANNTRGGGGGGAGAAGNAPVGSVAGAGGAGAEWPTGSGNYYAGGGGGGAWNQTGGTGGIGGGGAGTGTSTPGVSGTANTGGGGGAAGYSGTSSTGGSGGSGIVIVRYDPSTDWTPAGTVPDPPTGATAVAGDEEATVSFTPPVNDGGSPITGYTVTSSPGGLTGTGASSPIVVTGLTNGVSYTFTVVATNAVGDSVPSDPSNSVTPDVAPRGTYPSYITAVLLESDGVTPVADDPLENSLLHRFLDEGNGPGFGSCMLPLSEPGASELVPGRYVQISSNGTPVFTFMIEGNPKYSVIERGEEHDQVVTVQGRGWACVTDQATVYPSTLTLDIDTSWRLFSFASPDFPNDGAWVAAEELYEYLDGVNYPNPATPYRAPVAPDGLRYPAPIGYSFSTSVNIYDPLSPPGPNYVPTYWIWPPSEELSVGYAFFRREVTIPDDGVYNITVTGDNYFTLFLEGIPILGEDTLVGIWKYWKEGELFIPAGTYQLAAVVQNPPWSLGVNPGGFLFNLYTLDGDQVPTTSIIVSDDNWICDFDASIWPGWTPGQIIPTLTGEAIARGSMAAYAGDTFSATTDSNGNPWADAQEGSAYIPAFAADVGSTVMDALGKMVEEGHIDWHVHPDTLTLDAWAQGTAGATPGVTLAGGVNLLALEFGATTVYANSLLVQWERGYVPVEDSAAITAFGNAVEDIFSTQATSPDEAERLGEIELERRAAAGWPAMVAVVEPTSADDCPYEGFGMFDLLTAPTREGGTAEVPVLSISMQADLEGYATWTLELNRRWINVERDGFDLLRQIGGRSGKGYGVAE